MASYPTPKTEFIPAETSPLDFSALQAALELAEKLNYLTARITVANLMRKDADGGWYNQIEIDAWTKRLNDLPEDSED